MSHLKRECLKPRSHINIFTTHRKSVSVIGMSCTGCEENVENALLTLDDINQVSAHHEANSVEIVANESVSDSELFLIIEQSGCSVTG